MDKNEQFKIDFEEIVFRLNNITVRVKKDFVRIDTSSPAGVEADDYFLDFSNSEDVVKLCRMREETIKQVLSKIDTKITKDIRECELCTLYLEIDVFCPKHDAINNFFEELKKEEKNNE